MAAPSSSETEFSHRLTESLLTRKTSSTLSSTVRATPALSHQQSTPRFVTSLPPSAMVIKEKDSDSSFNQYIGNYFKEDAPVFLNRLSSPTATKGQQENHNPPESTFWTYLSKDLDSHKSPFVYRGIEEEEKNTTWKDYDSVFSEQTSLIASSPKFFSIGAYLFLFGFLCPPCWWIGSFYPANVKKDRRFMDENLKMALRWRLLNRYFSLGFSVLLVIVIIILAIVYTKMD